MRVPTEQTIQNRQRRDQMFCSERSYVERIFLKYKKDIHRYLKSMVSSEEDAHDLLQETYLKVCSREDIGRLDQNIKGYLFVVASNLAKDFIRKKATRHEQRHVPLNSVELISREASPENMAEWRESLDCIKATLLTLDDRCKQIFIMRRFMGYSTTDIAAVFKVSKRTIERDLLIAFEHIKNDLQEHKYYDD
ncbi:RNA polymerase sigma factor [Paremcibacter congregatus]|uniref:RNA polymerase sigma factor n=1 Tax=Paremcibacter congregatus TaxID=2043170 RepID=UPI0030EF52D2|tara:strand:- start:9255 stop:9833 length:579 start_codon:yes stop_codon:yes gene_type:complete